MLNGKVLASNLSTISNIFSLFFQHYESCHFLPSRRRLNNDARADKRQSPSPASYIGYVKVAEFKGTGRTGERVGEKRGCVKETWYVVTIAISKMSIIRDAPYRQCITWTDSSHVNSYRGS